MSREKFTEILKEYAFNDRQIELLWNGRPSDDLDEQILRETAESISYLIN